MRTPPLAGHPQKWALMAFCGSFFGGIRSTMIIYVQHCCSAEATLLLSLQRTSIFLRYGLKATQFLEENAHTHTHLPLTRTFVLLINLLLSHSQTYASQPPWFLCHFSLRTSPEHGVCILKMLISCPHKILPFFSSSSMVGVHVDP